MNKAAIGFFAGCFFSFAVMAGFYAVGEYQRKAEEERVMKFWELN